MKPIPERVTLGAEQSRLIREAVKRGAVSSESEAVERGLVMVRLLLDKRRAIDQAEAEEIDAAQFALF